MTIFILIVGLINVALGIVLATFLAARPTAVPTRSAESQPSAENPASFEAERAPSEESPRREEPAEVSEDADSRRLAVEIVEKYSCGLDEYDAKLMAMEERLAEAASGNGGELYSDLFAEIEQLTTNWLVNQGQEVDRARQSRALLGDLDHVSDQIKDAHEDLTSLANCLAQAVTEGSSDTSDVAFPAATASLQEVRDGIQRERKLLGLLSLSDPMVPDVVS